MEGLLLISGPVLLFTYFSLLDKLNPRLIEFTPSSHKFHSVVGIKLN